MAEVGEPGLPGKPRENDEARLVHFRSLHLQAIQRLGPVRFRELEDELLASLSGLPETELKKYRLYLLITGNTPEPGEGQLWDTPDHIFENFFKRLTHYEEEIAEKLAGIRDRLLDEDPSDTSEVYGMFTHFLEALERIYPDCRNYRLFYLLAGGWSDKMAQEAKKFDMPKDEVGRFLQMLDVLTKEELKKFTGFMSEKGEKAANHKREFLRILGSNNFMDAKDFVLKQ